MKLQFFENFMDSLRKTILLVSTKSISRIIVRLSYFLGFDQNKFADGYALILDRKGLKRFPLVIETPDSGKPSFAQFQANRRARSPFKSFQAIAGTAILSYVGIFNNFIMPRRRKTAAMNIIVPKFGQFVVISRDIKEWVSDIKKNARSVSIRIPSKT